MSPSDIAAALDGVVHEETQREGRGFDLTLSAVRVVERPGRVDFGGGELAPADTTVLEPQLRDAEDDYGWYDLDAGQYLIEYNETLDADERFLLQPREALVTRGAFHPTLSVERLSPVPLSVGGAGLSLKENARVSTLLAGV